MKARTIFMATLAASVLAACSNNDEYEVIDNSPSQATFSASIGGQASTRAYDQEWESGDQIGISGTTGDKTYTNEQYETTTGDGNFTVGDQGQEIYYQDDNDVTFTAYYPWNELEGGATDITADTRVQESQKTFDFLWAQQTGKKASPNVAFNFSHKMAKLVLTVKKGDDVSYQEVQDAMLSLTGFKNNGTFSVTDGTATATGEALSDEWTFANNIINTNYNAPSVRDDIEETVTYTLILFPQEFIDQPLITATFVGEQSFEATLDFTVANTRAGDTMPKNEWVAGRQYNLSLTLHKTSLTADSSTINAWDEVDVDNVDLTGKEDVTISGEIGDWGDGGTTSGQMT